MAGVLPTSASHQLLTRAALPSMLQGQQAASQVPGIHRPAPGPLAFAPTVVTARKALPRFPAASLQFSQEPLFILSFSIYLGCLLL